MSKREQAKKIAGSYVWRDPETGRLAAVKILRPQRSPTSTTVKKIRRAIRETNGVGKAK